MSGHVEEGDVQANGSAMSRSHKKLSERVYGSVGCVTASESGLRSSESVWGRAIVKKSELEIPVDTHHVCQALHGGKVSRLLEEEGVNGNDLPWGFSLFFPLVVDH